MSVGEMAEKHTVLRCVVGSNLYGLAIEGQTDRDEIGICVEPYEHFFGLRPRFENWTPRARPEGERLQPGDLDLTIYSLAKWCALALAGNPSVLQLLWVPKSHRIIDTPIADELRSLARYFVSDAIFAPFLGYMRQQRLRMVEQRKVPHRPELVAAHGYDTKYAGHLLRLGYQGIELAETGALTFPIRDPERQRLLDVRAGRVSQAEVLEEAQQLEFNLIFARDNSQLGTAKRTVIEDFVLDCYLGKGGFVA